MKKMRIAALLMALVLTVAVFAGCDKVKLDDVKADPAKFIADGLALTFEKTPFSDITNAAKKGSWQVVMKTDDGDADATLYLDTEAAKGALKLDLEVPTEYDFNENDEMVVTATENIKLDAYYADKQFAVKSDLLEEYVGTDALGINFDIKAEDIKGSELYNAVLGYIGITEEDLEEYDFDLEAIIKLFSDYLNKCVEIGKEAVEFDDITEETIEIDGTEVKTIVVPYSVKKDIYEDIADEAVKLVRELSKIVGPEEFNDEALKEVEDGIKESMPEYKMEGAYYISAKTGAVVKEIAESKIEMDMDGEEFATKVTSEVTYGADPTKMFLPAISFTVDVDGDKLTLEGASDIMDAEFVFDGEVKVKGEDVNEKGSFKFTIDEGGEFDLVLEADDEVFEISGSLTSKDGETELTFDLDKLYEEDMTGGIKELSLVIAADAEVPELPKYKNVLDFTEEDIEPILSLFFMGGEDYEDYEMTLDDYYWELTYYYDQEELDAELDLYAEYDYATRDDMIYDLYIGMAMEELVDYEFMTEDEVIDEVTRMVNEGYTYEEIADSMYETLEYYWDLEYSMY